MGQDILNAIAPIGAGALGAAGGGAINDFLGLGLDPATAAALFGGVAGGLTEGFLTGDPVKGLQGALEGGVAGPAIDNFASSLFSGSGLPNLFGGPEINPGGGPLVSPTSAAPVTGSAIGAVGAAGPGANIPLPEPVADLSNALNTGSGDAGYLTGAAADPLSGALSGTVGTATPLAGAANSAASGGLGGFLKDNSKWLLPAAGLGVAALKGDNIPQADNLTAQAGRLNANANALTAPLLTGKLPAGAQAAVDSGKQAAEASTRSRFASMGLSGNSTMEATALNSVDRDALSQGFGIAQNMANLGFQDAGLANSIYVQLMNAQLQEDQQLAEAFTNFGGAIGGGNGFLPQGTQLTVG